MDTQLRYYGKLRHAAHCGTLDGRDVYFLDVVGFGRAIVRRSVGTMDQTTSIFIGIMNTPDLDPISCVVWSGSDAAATAKQWVLEQCSERAAALLGLVEDLRADGLRCVEASPV
jgi:hypothetical protein